MVVLVLVVKNHMALLILFLLFAFKPIVYLFSMLVTNLIDHLVTADKK
jgi:hypothetical protein